VNGRERKTKPQSKDMSNQATTANFQPAEKRMMELGMDVVQIKKEISFALQHINKSDKLQKCTPESKLAAVVNIANIGLTLNPVAKEAYLIPRWNKLVNGNECALEPSYVGLVKLLTDAGSVNSMVTQVVYEHDREFELNLADNREPVVHKPELVKSKRGNIIGCYSLATLPDGTRQVEWMDIEELRNIRQRSETYVAYLAGKISTCTWITDESEMMRKTVVKRIYKYLPRTDRMNKIDEAIKLDNTDYTASDEQLNYIENLLSTSTLDDRQRTSIEMEMSVMNGQRASKVIEQLKNNQLDPITQGNGGSAKEINNAVKKAASIG
jgi:phage RecT family recombinase